MFIIKKLEEEFSSHTQLIDAEAQLARFIENGELPEDLQLVEVVEEAVLPPEAPAEEPPTDPETPPEGV